MTTNLRRIGISRKRAATPNPSIVHDEIDHAAVLEKARCFSHGQNPLSSLAEQQEDIPFRGAHKHELAGVLPSRQAANDDAPAIDGLVLNHAVQNAAKRIVTDDANGKGLLRLPRGRHRPLDETKEIQQESRLYLVLSCGLARGGYRAALPQSQTAGKAQADQRRAESSS
jgi:hypothetical protein